MDQHVSDLVSQTEYALKLVVNAYDELKDEDTQSWQGFAVDKVKRQITNLSVIGMAINKEAEKDDTPS